MKKLLYILVALGLLTATALGAVSWWVMQKMGPETWVELAEKNWNCRAQIDDAHLSLFTRPATLKFTGVRLAPRDLEVAKPYAERAPLPAVSALVEIPEITLEVKLDDLLNRRLFVEQLSIIRPSVRETQDAKGKSSLEALFKKPGSAEAVAATPETSPPPAQVETKAASESSPAPAFAYAVKSARIEKGNLDIANGTTKVVIQDLDFALTDIDVNTNDLVNHNQMKAALSAVVNVSGMARIQGAKRPAELAHLILSGQGDIAPLSPATKEWHPVSNLTLTLAKSSVLAGHMTIGDAAGKDLRKLQEYGVDLAPVVIGGPLQADAVVTGTFANDRFQTRSLTRFVFPEYEVAIEPKSWVNAAQDKHEIELRLSCGPALQSRLTTGIANAKLGDSLARAVTKALSDEQGRMTFDIESEGSLSSPKVKPKVDRVLKNLLQGDGLGDLLQGLLKKL
ncbi:hypothetical protein SAMN02745166_02769 [Prosthecobacter debontii]|uniref:AsmA family protein n=1 Tax=Prosthecobacter debontii TaxID=48467 RepID=A0A1T4Y9R4_9BACT|nr:hypothetical protein [Prosthecobacter debontii]SKA98496.1 hypothetical protein SAMN02745166_02769 [Prosthecobacter debontii]